MTEPAALLIVRLLLVVLSTGALIVAFVVIPAIFDVTFSSSFAFGEVVPMPRLQ